MENSDFMYNVFPLFGIVLFENVNVTIKFTKRGKFYIDINNNFLDEFA